MKNLSIVLNAILFIAVGILYFMEFNEPKENSEEESNNTGIAYVHADSLVKKYQFVIDQNNKLMERTGEIQQDYQNRATGLQREIQNYQRNLSNLTIAQAKKIEEDLGKKEQQLRIFQDQARQEVAGLESEVSNKLYKKISDFLERYSAENEINVVVKYDFMSDILYAAKPLDITDQVIDGLNKEYKSDLQTKNINKKDSTSNK